MATKKAPPTTSTTVTAGDVTDVLLAIHASAAPWLPGTSGTGAAPAEARAVAGDAQRLMNAAMLAVQMGLARWVKTGPDQGGYVLTAKAAGLIKKSTK